LLKKQVCHPEARLGCALKDLGSLPVPQPRSRCTKSAEASFLEKKTAGVSELFSSLSGTSVPLFSF